MTEPLLFFADENLRQTYLRRMYKHHQMEFMNFMRDPEIVMAAEQAGAIIMTADTWFLAELRQEPNTIQQRQRRRQHLYERAGIVLVPGEWGDASRRLAAWQPVIEAMAFVQRTSGRRLVLDISKASLLKADM